jgi:hypothetical protein
LNDAQRAVLADEKSAGTPLPDAAILLATLRSTIDAAVEHFGPPIRQRCRSRGKSAAPQRPRCSASSFTPPSTCNDTPDKS